MAVLRMGAHPLLLTFAVAAVAACTWGRAAHPAAPPPADRRAFPVTADGALEIPVPAGWIASAQGSDGEAPATIRLGQPGRRFIVLLTPYADPEGPEGQAERIEAVQTVTELARRQALTTSVEGEIPLQELVGEGVHGFWFGATDRALADRDPGPDEWRHVLQGAAAVGPLMVAFALLDDAPGPQREAVLEVVRGARHLPADGAARGGAHP